MTKYYYYEVCVSAEGNLPSALNPFNYGDKTRWVRKGEKRKTFIECQDDARANGERPWRIRNEFLQEVEIPVHPDFKPSETGVIS